MTALKLARVPTAALLLLALVALPGAATGQPLTWSGGRLDLGPLGSADVGVRLGLLETALLLLVSGIGTVVATYSARNLVGQRRLVRYAALETLTVVALSLVVTATSLPLLAVCWTLATLSLSALVAHAGTARSVRAARLVRNRLLIGDGLLWGAVVVAGVGVGSLDRADIAARVQFAPAAAVTATALLIAGAGIVRSALVPTHRWLPETAEAPSPVSALLHAGLVNGVGVLSLLVWPLMQAAAPARVLLFVAGATTAVVATAQMRTRADVKGRLAASTSSQMGYLAVQAALGIPAAVLAHVIGHGVWKASLFLGAGGTVERSRRGDTSAVSPTPLTLVTAAAAAAATVIAAALVPVPGWASLTAPAELLPLVVAGACACLALAAVAGRRSTGLARGTATFLALAVAAGYVLGLRGLGEALAGVVGEPAPWGTPEGWAAAGAVALLVVAGVAGTLVDKAVRAGRLPALARRIARSSAQPWSLRERLATRPAVALALPPVTDEDAEAAALAVKVASRTTGALYPLTSFVASNPLGGLEDLTVEDAARLAQDIWGAQAGPSARALREALADGRAHDADLDAVVDAAFPDDRHRVDELDVAGSTQGPRSLARALLLTDQPEPAELARAARVLEEAGIDAERVIRTPLEALTDTAGPGSGVDLIDRRARDLAHQCCARALAGPAWPGAAGPWQELRASAPALDQLLRVRGAGEVVAALPAAPLAATAALLEHLGVRARDRSVLVSRLLGRDPGWPSHLTWRARHAGLGHDVGLASPASAVAAEHLLVELVATRLAIEVVVAQAHAVRLLGRSLDASDLVGAPHDGLACTLATAAAAGVVELEPGEETVRVARDLAPLAHGRLALLRTEVLERAYRRRLLDVVSAPPNRLVDDPSSQSPAGHPTAFVAAPSIGLAAELAADLSAESSTESSTESSPRPLAQVVTCIDVRSERLRRQLEQLGPWETLGAAGFFGLPVRHAGTGGGVTERTPALLRPGVSVTERSKEVHGAKGCEDGVLAAARSIESAPGLPFGWAELTGWLQAPFVLLSTLAPRWGRALREANRRALGEPRHGVLDVVADVGAEALADAGAGFLATIGVGRLAPIVVIAGHGGRVANNPHVAAYDCGACGGSAGDINARVMADALNDPRVRALLRQRGVRVPEGSVFVAALHDTTRDVVEILDRDKVPAPWHDALLRLERDLDRAGAKVRSERLDLLPDSRSGSVEQQRRDAEARAADWAQPRPEWGLAGAAAIVVGPRELTSRLQLDGRVFLQSYRAALDPEGAVLEQLLAAPVVVAQWITAQYWASVVDPERFGAGDKTTHNVVGDGSAVSAVITGARGDLRIGLPWQAVSAVAPGATPHDPWEAATRHEPLRLLAVVHAEAATVDRLLARQPSVARLVTGGWITMSVVQPSDGRALTRARGGDWVEEAVRPAEGWDRESVSDAF